MKREEGQRVLLEIGASLTSGVNGTTSYLVVGEQDFQQYGDGFLSSKMKKAQANLKKGQQIELLTESQFLELL